jgi:hypothetical protein
MRASFQPLSIVQTVRLAVSPILVVKHSKQPSLLRWHLLSRPIYYTRTAVLPQRRLLSTHTTSVLSFTPDASLLESLLERSSKPDPCDPSVLVSLLLQKISKDPFAAPLGSPAFKAIPVRTTTKSWCALPWSFS